ncbi:MAG: InlB B-repeat-containing protein [Chitinispirillales bacterium]|jgi:uncharacterized protein (TIGR02145 family)/uncharacterized repeat protein (TIGR02543 family)|nr:InlB B-repeat-containing protein [Chitinispirillales bacterium]
MKNINSIFLFAFIAGLLTCEKVPDYCGNGALYSPGKAFCFGGYPYGLCNGREYNPLTNGCAPITGDVGTRCLNDSIVPSGTPCGGYTLATAAIPEAGGNVTRTPDKPTYNAGNPLILSAAPEPGYAFVAWVGAIDSNNAVVTYTMAGGNPLVSIAAIFKPTATGKLIIITEAFPKEGGTVSRNPDRETYNVGDTVRVTAAAKPGYAFDGWAGASVSKNDTVSVRMNESKTLVAVFKPETYKLGAAAIPADGGAIFINGTALPTGEQREVGAEVEATARAADGYVFVNWSGAASGTANPVTVAINGNKTLTANFKRQGVTPPGGGDVEFVIIGGKAWMSKNLNIQTANSYCYNNSLDSCAKYGRLYTWAAAKAACPLAGAGWRLPSRADWDALATAAGGAPFADRNLKSTSGWNNNGNGADAYGFSALPAGGRGGRGSDGSFDGAGDYGFWWTAEEDGSEGAYLRVMAYYHGGLGESTINKSYAFSVRCVGDDDITSATYTLTTTANPSAGGTVTRNPDATSYSAGTTVTVTATPASGYTFAGWSEAATGMANPITVTMDGSKNLTANFTQSTMPPGGGVDGDVEYVTIGGKKWMSKNLNVETANSYCYNNSLDSCAKYGRLYTWAAAKTACPLAGAGWRLPSRADWDALAQAAGGQKDDDSWPEWHDWELTGRNLKSTSGWNWNDYNDESGNGTDVYGFSALPAWGGPFAGKSGTWWVSEEYEYDADSAYAIEISYHSDKLYEAAAGKSDALSVRCVGD